MLNVKFVCNPETAEEYISEVKAAVKAAFPEKDIKFVTNKVVKNNGIELDGMSVRMEDLNICPTVYPVEAFRNGTSVEKLASVITESIRNTPFFDMGGYSAWITSTPNWLTQPETRSSSCTGDALQRD